MKKLTDAEKLEIAVNLLSNFELTTYSEICEMREKGCPDGDCFMCQLVECPYGTPYYKGDKTNPEAHGFHNTPAECENLECADCSLSLENKRKIDCPYLED